MIKNKLLLRIILFLFMLVTVINCFSVVAFASNGNNLAVSVDKYLTNELNVINGSMMWDKNKNVVVGLNDNETTVTLDLNPMLLSSENNALRIVLENPIFCEKMWVELAYPTGINGYGNVIKEVVVSNESGASEYIISAPLLESVRSVRLIFEGKAGGKVTLISIGGISYHGDRREFCGSLTKNEYDIESSMATLSGTVSWNTVSENPNAKIVVYRLGQDLWREAITNVDSYIASCDISLNYKLSFKLEKSLEYYSQYLIAILTSEGEIIPIAPEFYLTSKSHKNDIDTSADGFKGIETNMYAGAIESGSSFAFVEVCLQRFLCNEGSGFQYVVDGVEYYLDREYVLELDSKIEAYFEAGMNVYLRFVGVEGNADLIDIYDEGSLSDNVAYIEYILNRYSEEEGKIKGIVWGSSLDIINNNANVNNLYLDDYSKSLAQISAVLINIIERSGGNMELVLPFSDNSFGLYDTVSWIRDGYQRELLISSMLEYLRDFGVPLEHICFMLEGSAAPTKESDYDYPENSEGFEKSVVAAKKDDALNACTQFEQMLIRYSKSYERLSQNYIYCWYSSSTNTANNYIYNYNVAASMKNLKMFVVTTAPYADDMTNSEYQIFSSLKNAYKYADTTKNSEISKEALVKLAVDSWGDIIEGFDQSRMEKYILVQQELRNSRPNVIRGTYRMWDFDNATSSLGFEILYGCKSISVVDKTEEGEGALAVQISNGQNEIVGSDYGSILYCNDSSLNVEGISFISFDLHIPEQEDDKIYEILVRIEGNGRVIESSGVMFDGGESELYANIEDLDRIESITISSRDLSKGESKARSYEIQIQHISIHSNIYSDLELEGMVLSGGLVEDLHSGLNLYENNKLLITFLIVILSVILVLIVWFITKLSKKAK